MPCNRHRTCHPTPSQYTDTGHATPPRHSIQTQDMPPHPVTVYRHRTCHTHPRHSIQTQDMPHTPPSQYTDTGHATPSRHSIQTQDMTPHPVTVYRHRTCHPTPSQYTDTGHATPPRHSIQTLGWPVVALSIDAECFQRHVLMSCMCLRNPSLKLPHAKRTLYVNTITVASSWKLARMFTVPPSCELRSVVYESNTLSSLPQLLLVFVWQAEMYCVSGKLMFPGNVPMMSKVNRLKLWFSYASFMW